MRHMDKNVDKNMRIMLWMLVASIVALIILAYLNPLTLLIAGMILVAPIIFLAMLTGRNGFTAIIITLLILLFLHNVLQVRREDRRWRRLVINP